MISHHEDPQLRRLLLDSGSYDHLDDLRRDNTLLKSENDRLRREINITKSRLESAKGFSRDKYLESKELSYEVKHIVSEYARQIETFAKREAELLVMYTRLKRDNHRMRSSLEKEEGSDLKSAKFHSRTCIDIDYEREADAFSGFQQPFSNNQDSGVTPDPRSDLHRTYKGLFSPTSILRGLASVGDCDSTEA